jgi:hypothetical protein
MKLLSAHERDDQEPKPENKDKCVAPGFHWRKEKKPTSFYLMFSFLQMPELI